MSDRDERSNPRAYCKGVTQFGSGRQGPRFPQSGPAPGVLAGPPPPAVFTLRPAGATVGCVACRPYDPPCDGWYRPGHLAGAREMQPVGGGGPPGIGNNGIIRGPRFLRNAGLVAW